MRKTKITTNNNENAIAIFPEGLNLEDMELIIEQCREKDALEKQDIEECAATYLKEKELELAEVK